MNREMVDRDALAKFLAVELEINRFRDYCPNGLQVEGRREIKTLVSGVTASFDLLQCAVELNADAVLVHHGYFWRGEDMRVIGSKMRRLKCLLQNEISLFAYHLPLDAHAELGNNVQLAHVLGLQREVTFGDENLGCIGRTIEDENINLIELAQRVHARLGRAPLVIGEPTQPVTTIAWCTGAAHTMLDAAIAAGASVFMSGEVSEPIVHLARESGVGYLACGHHATERYGVQALGDYVARTFGITHHFVDIDNPV